MSKVLKFTDLVDQLDATKESIITEFKSKRQEYESEKKRVSDEIAAVIGNVEKQHQSMLEKVEHSKKQINKTKNQQRSLVKQMLEAETAGDSKAIKDLELKLADLESNKMTLQAIVGSYENNEVFEVAADRNKLITLNAQMDQIKFDKTSYLKSLEDIEILLKEVEKAKETIQSEINKGPVVTTGNTVGIYSLKKSVMTSEISDHEYLNQKYDPLRPRIDKNRTIDDIFSSWMRSSEDIKFTEYFPREIERRKQEQIRREAAEDAKKLKEREERDERNRLAYEAQTKRMNMSPPTF